MSDAFWVSLPGILAGLAAILSIFWNARKIAAVDAKVEIVHKATNSMKDELVKVTGEAEHAKGKLEGTREAGTARSDAQERHTA